MTFVVTVARGSPIRQGRIHISDGRLDLFQALKSRLVGGLICRQVVDLVGFVSLEKGLSPHQNVHKKRIMTGFISLEWGVSAPYGVDAIFAPLLRTYRLMKRFMDVYTRS